MPEGQMRSHTKACHHLSLSQNQDLKGSHQNGLALAQTVRKLVVRLTGIGSIDENRPADKTG